MSTKNLKLLGALVCGVSRPGDWPEPICKVINKAKKEVTDKLDTKQFDLWRKAGRVGVAPVDPQ